MGRKFWLALVAATALTAAPGWADPTPPAASSVPVNLESGFRDPPASARPRVWWHWMNGNVSKDGIAKDIAWMKRVGIGGLQNFDANLATPQIVDKPLVYMTPEWKDAFRFAASEADRQGLELAIASSPGWSETGGPWVPPEDAMKKLVWSETRVAGGKRFAGILAAPPSVTGPYASLPAGESSDLVSGVRTLPSHYADIAVLAFPIAAPVRLPIARMASGDGKPLDVAALTDDSLTSAATIGRGSRDKPPVITIDYDRPHVIRSVTLFVPGAEAGPLSPGLRPRLEVSETGGSSATDWRAMAEFVLTSAPATVSFPPVAGRHFRIVFAAAPAPVGQPMASLPKGVDLRALGNIMGSRSAGLQVADLRLSEEARVNQFETKAGFSTTPDYYALDGNGPVGAEGLGTPVASVIDLTGHLQPDGSLDWTPPRGNWRVVRLGWSLVGKLNHPATDAATGLEVDKMDAGAVKRYLDHYLGMYRETVGGDLFGARGVRAFLNDSTEVGPFNWTPGMIGAFRERRGYDPTPWLPVLTGSIIGSRRESDAFLYDYRRTIADLHASAHYGTIVQVAHEAGLKTYGEAIENGRSTLGDDMAMRSHADYPMAAMWFIPRGVAPRPGFLADMKGASSVAHIYGQNIAAAESMTSILFPWGTAPSDLRQTIDLEFAYGINRAVIHTSVHQPVDDQIPGLSLGAFGQYFNRHESWAEMAKPWVDYIARNSFLLQQGRNVADVGYFFGEEAPLSALYGEHPVADAPTRYAYDFVSPDTILNQLSVRDGDLVSPGGARYRLLYLGGSSRMMTLPVLRRLEALADEGAMIVGPAPIRSPSLADDPAAFDTLTRKLWSGQPVTSVGKGRVIAGSDVEAALATIGATPDFAVSAPATDSRILFVHRKLADGDLYFVNNRQNRTDNVTARFRVTGKAPEIWHADSGIAEPLSYRSEGDTTVVPLVMGPEEAFFVLFRKPATATSRTVAATQPVPVATLDDAWTVAFQPGRGAPPSTLMKTLAPLNEQDDAGIRYFSGVATYARRFALPAGVRPGDRLLLDLGAVGDLAEVSVNGKPLGTVWHAPYRLDIGRAVRRGVNRIEVRVANLWVNRLMGDMQQGAHRITYTSGPTYTAQAPLRPSGLIGPVRLLK